MDIYGGDLYNALFDYMSEEMPYGTQKGRDGDPVEYMQDELDSMGMFGEPTSQFDIYNMPSESVEENNTARLKRELDFDPDKVRSFINNLAKKQKTSALSDKEKQDFADAQELLADLSADLDEAKATAGPDKCWPGYKKVGTKPGTGKNKGKTVNDCKKA